MGTVIMLFILPLGIAVYIWDKKVKENNLKTFMDYIEDVKNSKLSEKEKLLNINNMLYRNGYNQVELSENSLVMEKKQFNLGVLFIALGTAAYFGILFYIIYYKFFLKPDQISVTLKRSALDDK